MIPTVEQMLVCVRICQTLSNSYTDIHLFRYSAQKRNRVLPTPIIILLVISLNFWSRDSVVDVWKNLVEGLMSDLIPQKIRLITPSSSSFTEARQRVGAGVMAR